MNKPYWILALLLLMALATACSNDEAGSTRTNGNASNSVTTGNSGSASGQPTTKEDTPQTQTPAQAESATKMVVDALGREVEIPTQPQSIVALWSVGEILALGEKPIGSTSNLLRFYTEEQRSGIEIVGDGAEGDLEKVMSLQPDLIIISARAEAHIENYSKIAPTVTTPFFGDPFDTFHAVAEILNKPDEAERWLADYKARVEEKRTQTRDLKLSEQSALVIQFALKNIYTYRSSTFPVVFNDYQFKLTAKQEELQQDPAFGNLQLSLEVLPDFDADHLFVMISDDDSRQVYEELSQSEVWKNMKAAKNNQVHLINNRMAINDVATMDWALDEIYGLLHEQ